MKKIGFPDSYREGKESIILYDINAKLPNLSKKNQIIVDIGAGCGVLANSLIDKCAENNNRLILIDSEEMLSQLPDKSDLVKIIGYYPDECGDFIKEYAGKVDVILTYSVFHYIFDEGNLYKFLDSSLKLLADGGEFLIGDIPNISKRKRFFSSQTGIKFHQKFMNTTDEPQIEFNKIESGEIDDSVLFALILRARQSGFDSYILPQLNDLPMANRREDILIRKP